MRARLLWVASNADGVISVLLAGFVSVLGFTDSVSDSALGNTIALTLAVLAFSVLRDRWHEERDNAVRQEAMTEALQTLRDLPARLDRLSGIDRVLVDTRTTLEETLGVAIVTGSGISRALEEARAQTDRWYFKGATGTYVRAVTLPECVKEARRTRRKLDVRLEILDPTDARLCEDYAQLYRTLADEADGRQSGWTGDGTRRELFATILAACWHQQRYRPMDLSIGLSSVMTTFRWDLSSTSLVITQRGPRFPAMVVRRGRSYYDSWNTELHESLKQSRKLPLERASGIPLSQSPGADEVRALFRALDLRLPDEYEDDDLLDIARKAIQESDPYT
ncbi:hypothetical protein AB0F13_25855 [Streptomyces sp. NPDC026206]|uniref:hypothetical protein n=1 Tax=Streptomyces sp. NPDC026206 TaxID=3157089 RepID=UPI0033CEC5A9